METKYKITVPTPCHENWDSMPPDTTGRFCSSCTKNVVDFTSKSATEIQQYFIDNQGKNTCGRFKNEQLDVVIIKIPKHILFTQVHFHKMFILALFISMGTTLFSCQDDNGDSKKIDGIELEDSNEHRTTGIVMSSGYIDVSIENDSLQKNPITKKQFNQESVPKLEADTLTFTKGDVDTESIIDTTKVDTK
jgi:hypothetical protein